MSYHIDRQLTLFEHIWQEYLDLEHELIKLADRIDWDKITESLRRFYSKDGRHGKEIRLMVGLHILKHRYNLSDEVVVKELHENIYYLYFCGIRVSRAFRKKEKILEESTMTRFRRRIGAEGIEIVEQIIKEHLIKEKKLSPRTHIIDTTAMEKYIEHPSDISLLNKGRKKLVRIIGKLKDCGVKIPVGLRSFLRVSKKVLVSVSKLGRRSEDQIKKGIKEMVSFTRHVVKRIPEITMNARKKLRYLNQSGNEKTAQTLHKITSTLTRTEDVVKKIIHQGIQRLKDIHIPNKIYSVHEPEVTCIRKGKRVKPDEYGSKVRLSMDRNGFIVSHKEYTTNLSDTGTLEDALNDWQETFGRPPSELAADRGFHQDKEDYPDGVWEIDRLSIPSKGRSPHPHSKTYWFKRLQRMRSAIEPVISHLKHDYRMHRCRYSGFKGDQINVSLAVIAWNIKKWMNPQPC